jgi:hypothetical protein
MLTVKPLRNSQSDWGGSAACTVCCCTLSRYILIYKDQLDLSHPTTMAHIDSAIAEAVSDWKSIGAGVLSPGEVLKRLPELAEDLCVVKEEGPLYDDTGHLIVPGLAESLYSWTDVHSGSTTCVIVRGGYTFLLFRLKANYYVIDTHANSIERHAGKLSDYVQLETAATGLLLSTLFFEEAVSFVKNYNCTVTRDESSQLTSSNQIDLTILALTEL